MDPLQRLLQKAIEADMLLPILLRVARLRTSFYADDAFLFVTQVFDKFWANIRAESEPGEECHIPYSMP